ncbi:MAG: 1,4-dihydroxy-2-naphthoate octaprenyltransferase [Desulfobacterales bacterium C00003060]|nr:MAG: 1,4-dihydroxy-2-naphthoate octaprenyltransferase [Desulfobacterales bacterium S3730MH5]OEU81802.1 MAG: 1,4-dihydroxy-2-naphthoate octaprenyltransferase [Desulfobacterales bacterium C00003060]OEU83862.1 MAG: 1,4-dihydroxy-2-naphthoate octaprenyltransferase [Desulfobacterales bacterium S5133MH4]
MNAYPESCKYKKWQVWWLAARPKTLWAGIIPVIVGTVMAFEVDKFHMISFLATLTCSVLIQVGTNFANDVFDFQKGTDDETRKGPMRVTQAGLVTPHQMKIATTTVLGLAFLAGIYLVWRAGWPIMIIGLLSLLLAVLYTYGPFPLGYIGLGDILVLIFFGPVAVGGTYFIFAGHVNTAVLLAGFALGMIATAILVVNNLRDMETDKKSGKHTLAVRFGAGFARTEYLLMICGAMLVPITIYAIEGTHVWTNLAALYIFPAIPVTKKVLTCTNGQVLNDALAGTARLLAIFGALFSLGWLL